MSTSGGRGSTEKPDKPETPTCSVEINEPIEGSTVAVGVPISVKGSASSSSGTVTSVTLMLGTTPVTVVDDTGDWAGWHAVVTFSGPGQFTLAASATDSLKKKGGAKLKLTVIVDSPVLTCVKPALGAGNQVVTQTVAVPIEIQAKTVMLKVNSVAYQLDSGPSANLTAPDANTPNWHGTIMLPTNVALAQGRVYNLTLTGNTDHSSGTLNLTLKAVDETPPNIVSVSPDKGSRQQAGAQLVVTAQVSDPGPGVITTGVASVTVQLDNGPLVSADQTVPGDPSTWQANVGVLSHDPHQVSVTAKDLAGNTSAPVVNKFGVKLDSWSRLEPIPRDPTLMEGLQARIADPLWMLARQVAFGEFRGHDAASPVSVRLRGRFSTLTRVRPAFDTNRGQVQPATGPGTMLPADGGPLETFTESEPEPAAGVPRPLFAAQAGLHYVRMLRAPGSNAGSVADYVQGLVNKYPLPPAVQAVPGVPPKADPSDPALQPFLGNVPDGAALYADLDSALRGPGTHALPATPALGRANTAGVTSVATHWLDWYDAVSGRSMAIRDTWRPDRMEYAFGVAAPGPDAETVLAAAECDTGELDWFDFDFLASGKQPASQQVSLGAVAADRADGKKEESFVRGGFPTPVTFRGMPNRRWWDFDDASIDFGSISAPIENVAASLIVEFAMRYGNDQFIIPVKLPVGSIVRIDGLVVTDTYGEVLAVRHISERDGPHGPFRLFEQSLLDATGKASGQRDSLFVLFPTVGEIQTGPAIEEVHFMRDETAELVWAIEQTVLGKAGIPVDRNSDAMAHFKPLTPTPNDGASLPTRNYVLRTDVEQNWFPFLLPDDTSGTSLVLATVPPLDQTFTTPVPWGRILAPFAASPPVPMPQEEVTRAGAQVVRAWRYARWIDGRQLSWVGRRVRPGRGPGASGLSHDLAT